MCCVPESHEKRCCAITLIIFNIIFAVVGVALLVLAIIFLANISGMPTFPIVILIVAIVILVAAVLGFIGSCYESGSDNKCSLFSLNLYWVIAFLAAIVLIAFGVLCFAAKTSVESAIVWAFADFLSRPKDDDVTATLTKGIKFFIDSVYAVGAVSLAAGIVIVVSFVFVCYLLGKQQFLLTTSRYGSLLISAVGLLVLIVFILLLVLTEDLSKWPKVTIAGIAVGGVLLFVGVWGFITYCCCLGKKCPSITHTILLTVMVVACIAVGIVGGVLISQVTRTEVEASFIKNCEFPEAEILPGVVIKHVVKGSDCEGTMKAFQSMLCNSTSNAINCNTKAEDRMGQDTLDLIKDSMNYIYSQAVGGMIALCVILIVVALFLLYMTITAYILSCCCRYGEEIQAD
ncbi:hypothetical protein BLNAU_19830 [Blattamonas nauphoetae]|uniref:Uncharacterized protein n=1 Tax=Blattamonas nauphoetae TaxID=2049346 RepID=A0ABQ9X0G2_9EUKA|nr:hypothetical protein BLNAU_19830 [Blattamonas nauphoetae]